MKVSRVICVYNTISDKLIEEISIEQIPFDVLRRVTVPRKNDPLMYDVYEITPETFEQIKNYVDISPDFDTYSYYIECFQAE